MMRYIPLFLLLVFPSFFLAQNQYFNQQLLPLGDESSLLGNSGIAGQSPHSAAIFNPAALVLNEDDRFSFSGNAYYRYTFESEFQIAGSEQVFLQEADAIQILPSSMIYQMKKGKWHWSFALTVPMYFHYDGSNRFDLRLGTSDLQLSSFQSQRESMYTGFLAAARNLGQGWSLGFSLYGSYYHLISSFQVSAYQVDDPSFYFTNGLNRQAESYTAGLMMGVLKQGDRFNWGLNLASPSVGVYGNGEYAQTTTNGGTNASLNQDFRTDLNTNLHHGMRIGTGLSYQISDGLNWSGEFNYFFKQESALFFDQEAALASWRVSTGLRLELKENTTAFVGFAYLPAGDLESQWETLTISGGTRFKVGKTVNTIGFFVSQSDASAELKQLQSFTGIMVGTSVPLNLKI